MHHKIHSKLAALIAISLWREEKYGEFRRALLTVKEALSPINQMLLSPESSALGFLAAWIWFLPCRFPKTIFWFVRGETSTVLETQLKDTCRSESTS